MGIRSATDPPRLAILHGDALARSPQTASPRSDGTVVGCYVPVTYTTPGDQMRLRSKRTTAKAVVILVMGATAAATPPAVASLSEEGDASTVSYTDAVPALAPSGVDATAIYFDSAGQRMSVDGAGESLDAVSTDPQAALGPCTPVSGRDNPHRSKTGVAASGHGWWDKGDCSNSRATVYNCIYEYYSDGSWRQKDCSDHKELYTGGGGGNRTTARKPCDDQRLTSWRNHVAVDVIGEWDTGETPFRENDIACRVT